MIEIKDKNKQVLIENAEHFTLLKVRFYLKAAETVVLNNFKGFTLRGGFGNIFKKIACIDFSRECGECILRNKCVYAYIFETPFPENLIDKIPFQMAYPPRPYIIEPPFDSQIIFNSADEFYFDLVLIGKSIEYLPYFIFAFEELGKRGIGRGKGKYRLLKVEGMDGQVIYQEGGLQDKFIFLTFQDILNRYRHCENPSNADCQITIRFVTPARFVLKDELKREVNFKEFITNLLRRISLLSIFHSNKELVFDYLGLLDDAQMIEVKNEEWDWCDLARYSRRQGRRIATGGLLGEVTFFGNLLIFLPFIELGEYIHIGKQTSFGLGKYEIKEIIWNGN